jgi:hypothetical protein
MLNRKKSIFVIILALSIGNLFSQGGSNYSIFGIGDIYFNSGSYYNGLGGTSLAVKSDRQINILNPALLAPLKTTRLQTGYLFNQNYISSDKSSLFQNNGKVNGLQAIFALDTANDIAVSLGISAFSNVNYYISNPISLIMDKVEYKGSSNYLGSGGLSLGHFGVSAKVIKGLYMGALATYKFGTISSSNTTYIYDQYAFYSTSQRINRISGAGLRGGLYYEPITDLAIGAYFDKSFSLTNDQEYRYGSELVNDTIIKSTSNLDLPTAIGFGASYRSNKFLFALDYITQDFTNFNFNKSSKFTYQPFNQISFGVSRIGNRAYSADFLDRISYNFGIGYKNQYYQVGTNKINDYYFSFGMEMPIVGNALLNTSFVFGQRGLLDNGLVKENYGRFIVDFSIGETWFKPFIREY